MSLVSYDYSSAEDSSSSDDDGAEQTTKSATDPLKSSDNSITGPETATKQNDTDETATSRIHLQLPAPKKTNDLNVEEEDDEFLRKKATPVEAPPAKESNIKPKLRNGKVQITIPSMSDFKDVDDGPGGSKKDKVVIGAALPKKATGLLSMLPKPKTNFFQPSSKPQPSPSAVSETGPGFSKRLVPDSVANRPRSVPASAPKSSVRPPLAPAINSSQDPDSDDGEDGGTTDYFSFNKVDTLPTVSANEITAMVAKKAAKIADTVRKFTETEPPAASVDQCTKELSASVMPETAEQTDLANETAMAALIGGNRAKRARVEQVDLIEITSEDIVPSKADFLRRQLQDETGYVPTGHLVGDWTCTSRRKSHITQLANKAQANAQELEAMWAANRQSRRQTQSKYGF
ncbi:uncharacterized protein LOC128275374 [Anopheles cruzii]|uniref:uncharacterized protein LOC128275374 n=1 Tax=Anopheles cruzii TaxID=68878 RepID=UPI0022EC5526|nr:uncharacterized protein LOC128275374 [Anopheles cruzii]